MLYDHSTEKLVRLQGIEVKNIIQNEKYTEIHIQAERKVVNCPCCGAATWTIHDYRLQRVKDIPAFGKHIILFLRKRRYRCTCGKRFYEELSFLPKYYRMTNRLAEYILDKLREVRSYTSIAGEVNLSVTTVIRIFDNVSYPKPHALPSVVSIDEFKGNTNGEKYQCILTDPKSGIVFDVLPKRYEHYLCDYFKHIKRIGVEYFISDMWRTYSQIAATYIKNAVPVVDKYHWIRQAIWAFEAVRKQGQKKFSKSHRIYFKRSKTLLSKRFQFLSEEEKQQVNVMLYASPTLSSAHFLKEQFLKILDCNNSNDAKIAMRLWIENAEDSGIIQFVKCAKTMRQWFTGIINSFDCPFTNGFTEGCNNKIKVLKRNAYGFRNFPRFRNRILHIFSDRLSQKQTVA